MVVLNLFFSTTVFQNRQIQLQITTTDLESRRTFC